MKNSLIIIFFSLLLLSCTEKKIFDSFDYSYEGTFSEVYSIKFTQSDTVYLQYHWIAKNIDDSISQPKENVIYYGILNSDERMKLYDYIEKVNLFKYQSEYYENYVDGSSYGINIQKDSKNKTVIVHSHKAPKEIDSISHWISRIKRNLKLKESKKNITFESKNGVLPPPPPPPPVIKN